MNRILLLLLIITGSFQVNAQLKSISKTGIPVTELKQPTFNPTLPQSQNLTHVDYTQLGKLTTLSINKKIKAYQFDKNKMPIHIKGNLKDFTPELSRQAFDYLEEIAPLYHISNAEQEWVIKEITTDEIGMQHIKVQQVINEIPVFAGELTMHAKKGRIETVMGRGFPTPELASFTPKISARQAEKNMTAMLSKMKHFVEIPSEHLKMLDMNQVTVELVVYHKDDYAHQEFLAYHIKAYENLGSYKTYFMDANTGEIIHDHDNICNFHADHMPPPDGPKTANATDLNGINRTIDTYESGGNFFLINATKPNFSSSQSTMPNEPKGVIWTMDAQNSSPSTDDFTAFHVATSDNNSWNDRSSVSAHYNAGIAYDYFKNIHARNAIDGGGGNIISFVNVTDEDDADMDNAFWNGVAMFYGNGNTEFSELAGSLDVAGHEMSHGVVQSSANLKYEGESGALNESFADIFGVMMDRDDYKIGEDVVSSAYTTGALRDMANPNNGGSKLGDRGYQPGHVNQQYFGSADNGGVHINSGIVNHAFFLFAEAVGKDKAEKVYYRALTQYLTRSSQFIDARIAVVQAAQDLYGANEANAAKAAYDQVGIGESAGGDYTNDATTNEGDGFIVFSDGSQTKLQLANGSLELVLDPASASPPYSKPSVTDDGSLIFYVNADNQIAYTAINWDSGEVNVDIWQDQEIWANVAISKDGNRIAAVELAQSNRIHIYDFSLQEWYTDDFNNLGFQLYNPTFSEGVSTGDAKFADAMDFDISGEVLMFDVYSEIDGSFGEKIGYWDIGFLNVFDNSTSNWSDGQIAKLFSNLADGLSVGNPTFSKNSPYIIAFDYIEDNERAVIGANIETGDIENIFDNSSLGYPAYTATDEQMVFTNESTFNTDIFIVNLDETKITPIPSTVGNLISDAKWGVPFRNGTRTLSDVEETELIVEHINVFPNPSSDMIYFELELENKEDASIEIRAIDGRLINKVNTTLIAGKNRKNYNISDLQAGQYSLNVITRKHNRTAVFTKL
ncbi:M4 family metallopeptidase [Portibacter lacus]|uniref:T9SS type A sorting domain-containing protein n=1 Tax=Portibacter lacus TaxID=1099794 RepID=A0AA37SS61_9BACT|nr:M4 family metallopeptidase [Portibacter lacus]GLR19262.1 hypothetical protein GCM10007940_38780 [Portibacter lacus]